MTNSSENDDEWSLHFWQLPLSNKHALSSSYEAAKLRYVNAKYGSLGTAREEEFVHLREYWTRLDSGPNANHANLILPTVRHLNSDCPKWKCDLAVKDIEYGISRSRNLDTSPVPPAAELQKLVHLFRTEKKPSDEATAEDSSAVDGTETSNHNVKRSVSANDNNYQHNGEYISQSSDTLQKSNSDSTTIVDTDTSTIPPNSSYSSAKPIPSNNNQTTRDNKDSKQSQFSFKPVQHNSSVNQFKSVPNDCNNLKSCNEPSDSRTFFNDKNRYSNNECNQYAKNPNYSRGSENLPVTVANHHQNTSLTGYQGQQFINNPQHRLTNPGQQFTNNPQHRLSNPGQRFTNFPEQQMPNTIVQNSNNTSGRGGRGPYPWQRINNSNTRNSNVNNNIPQQQQPPPTSFRTASHQLLLNQAKQNSRGGGGGGNNSGQQNYGGASNCGNDSVSYCNTAGNNGPRRSLGARAGAVSGKFIPPVRREDSGGMLSGNNQGEEDQPGPYDHLMGDPRLKNIDVKMVELIMNEVLDEGLEVRWDDIAGLVDAKNTIQEVVVYPMLRPDIFTGLRGPPKGVLLFGPPGTGKTMIGKAIASQSGATFFSISASCLTSKWVGEGEKMVRTLFAVARIRSPSVIFIDEIDSLLSHRSETEHESSRRIKTEFLVQLDGVGVVSEQVLVVGATNRPQELDEAARRRLVKRLYIPLPETQARRHLINKLLERQRHDLTSDDILWVADNTEGYSGADVAAVCSEAAMGPIRAIPPAEMRYIALDQVRGMSREDFKMSVQSVRPSVCQQDLQQYRDWNDKYGIVRPKSALV